MLESVERSSIPLLKINTKKWKTHLKQGRPFFMKIEKVKCFVDRGQNVLSGEPNFAKCHGHLKQVLEKGLYWIDKLPKRRRKNRVL